MINGYGQLGLLFVLCCIVVGRCSSPTLTETDQQSSSSPQNPVNTSGFGQLRTKSLYVLEAERKVGRAAVQDMLDKSKSRDGVVFYSLPVANEFTASAPGVDLKHYVVHEFLEGYMPFKTDNIMIPLLTLSRKKRYQYDHIHYGGLREVWQSSSQAFQYTRGDCEDHAIALADWLIALGWDARVVLGRYQSGGHAWVVLFHKGKEYLLEATRKRGVSASMSYPLAKFRTDYHPHFMFNRDSFWKNTGSTYTTNYSSVHWQKKSAYGI